MRTIEKPKGRARIYFATGESGLRNGSFLRVSRYGVACLINGDFMGTEPRGERGVKVLEFDPHDRVEFASAVAERLIPECCGGKGAR